MLTDVQTPFLGTPLVSLQVRACGVMAGMRFVGWHALRYAEDVVGIRGTVGFHNLNLRIFNLRVSNPNE